MNAAEHPSCLCRAGLNQSPSCCLMRRPVCRTSGKRLRSCPPSRSAPGSPPLLRYAAHRLLCAGRSGLPRNTAVIAPILPTPRRARTSHDPSPIGAAELETAVVKTWPFGRSCGQQGFRHHCAKRSAAIRSPDHRCPTRVCKVTRAAYPRPTPAPMLRRVRLRP